MICMVDNRFSNSKEQYNHLVLKWLTKLDLCPIGDYIPRELKLPKLGKVKSQIESHIHLTGLL